MQRIFLSGEVGFEITLDSFRAQSSTMNEGEISIHINSPGGDVGEGWAIYDEIRYLAKTHKVITVNDGLCASMASVIFLAGDKRVMRPNSKLMIHNPWGAPMGDSKEIERYLAFIKDEESKMARFYSQKTGILLEKISSMMDQETWLDASQAIELGFASEMEQLKAVAKFTHTKTEMKDNFTEEQKSWLAKQFEALGNVFKKHIKAMVTLMIVTEEGEIPLYIDSEDGEIEGKSAYLDEAMSQPAPEGVHKLQDGREITVSSEGVIDSVSEEAESMDKDKEIEMLKEEIEMLKGSLKSQANEVEEKTEALATAQKSMNEIRAMIEGDSNKPNTKGKASAPAPARAETDSSEHPIQIALKARKAKK
jgi:ATP-dependent Clp protease, protease subunit